MKIKRHGSNTPKETTLLVNSAVTDVCWERDWLEYWQKKWEYPDPGYEGRRYRRDEYKKAKDSFSILVKQEPDPQKEYVYYDYNIILSLDDIVEIIKALSSSIDSQPVIQKALGPHVRELLAIALAASDG